MPAVHFPASELADLESHRASVGGRGFTSTGQSKLGFGPPGLSVCVSLSLSGNVTCRDAYCSSLEGRCWFEHVRAHTHSYSMSPKVK